MQVFRSRFTPGVLGDEVDLKIGETVKFELLNGKTVDVEICSGRMKHARCETFGFEGIFSDDGQKAFADGKRIIGWEGRVA